MNKIRDILPEGALPVYLLDKNMCVVYIDANSVPKYELILNNFTEISIPLLYIDINATSKLLDNTYKQHNMEYEVIVDGGQRGSNILRYKNLNDKELEMLGMMM